MKEYFYRFYLTSLFKFETKTRQNIALNFNQKNLSNGNGTKFVNTNSDQKIRQLKTGQFGFASKAENM